jgi:hypothetical protein
MEDNGYFSLIATGNINLYVMPIRKNQYSRPYHNVTIS